LKLAEESSYEKLVEELKSKGMQYFETPLMVVRESEEGNEKGGKGFL
jgi:hypothetical protein